MTLLRKFLTTPSKLAFAFDRSCTSSNVAVESIGSMVSAGQPSILCLDIETELIGMTIGWHPSTLDEGMPSASVSLPSLKLESIPTLSKNYKYNRQHRKRRLVDMNSKNKKNSGSTPFNVVQLIDSVVQKYNVCGILVAWPVQRDTGKVGASCGRVLHSLENLLASIQEQEERKGRGEHEQQLLLRRPNGATNARSRDRYVPICLWNPCRTNSVHVETTDEWGRNSSYGGNPNDPYFKAAHARAAAGHKVHIDDDVHYTDDYRLFEEDDETDDYHPMKYYYASKERYNFQQELASSRRQRQSQIVWDDFCRFHWPSYCNYNHVGTAQKSLAKKRASLIPGYSRKWKNAFHQDGDDSSSGSTPAESRPIHTPDVAARATSVSAVDRNAKKKPTYIGGARSRNRNDGNTSSSRLKDVDKQHGHWDDSTFALAALV